MSRTDPFAYVRDLEESANLDMLMDQAVLGTEGGTRLKVSVLNNGETEANYSPLLLLQVQDEGSWVTTHQLVPSLGGTPAVIDRGSEVFGHVLEVSLSAPPNGKGPEEIIELPELVSSAEYRLLKPVVVGQNPAMVTAQVPISDVS